MTLVAGSYDRIIWGFSLEKKTTRKEEEEEKTLTTLKPLFHSASHSGPIKCCAVSGPVAVSGGSDDSIKIYDLRSATEMGHLFDRSGCAVSSLAFYTTPTSVLHFPRNLVAGSDGGEISIYDVDPFVHLKSVGAHRRAVSDVAVHPSGRLALSVGRDGCLAMVNLLRGRRSFFCRLQREASLVRYSVGGGRGGERFFMASEERVGVHDSEDARLLVEIAAGKRVLCLAPAENGLLFTGGEDRCISAWDSNTGKEAYCIEDAHQARIKGLVVLGSGSTNNCSDAPYLVASASSDGVIRVWDIRMTTKERTNHLAEANTKSRLTCLAGSSFKSVNTDCGKKRAKLERKEACMKKMGDCGGVSAAYIPAVIQQGPWTKNLLDLAQELLPFSIGEEAFASTFGPRAGIFSNGAAL